MRGPSLSRAINDAIQREAWGPLLLKVYRAETNVAIDESILEKKKSLCV